MKKFSIFLMMLCFACFGVANAQSTHSWGSSSTNSGSNRNANPFGRYYGYEYRVYLYQPNTMNGVSGDITKLEFLPSSTMSSTGGQIDVWMKSVTDITSLSSSTTFATYKSGATLVYSNSSSPSYTSGSYVSIPLSTPIAYNYSNNEYLMILVRSVASSSSGDSGSTFYYYNPANASNNTWYAKKDGSDPGENTISGFSTLSTGAYLPVIRVTYTTSTNPSISLNPANATVITGSTQPLTANLRNVSGTPTITYSSSNTSVATVSGSGTTATVTGVAPGTATITASMTYQGTTYTATCAITVENPSYCTPGTGNYDGSGISNVTFGTNGVVVNNTVGGTNYGNYSNLVGAVDAGTTCQVDITYKTGYTYGTIIWVDWNHSYTFEGTEAVYAGTSGSANPTTLNATFPVPATTQAGDYRMRIIGSDMALDSYTSSLSAAANADPCGSYNYSTCHDYTLRVNAGAYTITCATTTGGTITADKNNADENDVITITATPETDYLLTALTYTPEGGSAQNIDITSTPYTFTMPAANVTVNATFSLIRNLPPYHLTVGTPLGHSVELGWTGVSTNTNHQNFEVYYSTTNTAPSDNLSSGYETTTTVPYTLAGLDPSTTYYAWVRDNCGTDGKSAWVAFNAFTTDEACSAPSNLTVSNLTAHSANVSWNGEGESYTVLYHTATVTGTTQSQVFFDGFENGLGNWTTYINGYSNENTNWMQYTGTFSDSDSGPHTGSYVAMSRSWTSSTGDVSVDNWLVTPQMILGDVVKFWVLGNGDYPDSYAVYVSTSTNATSDFTQVRQYVETTGTWAEQIIDISAYAGQQGYVAIRHTNYAGDHILVDDFGVYETVNTYSYGTTQYVNPNPTTNSCNITGLSAETLYEVQVQAECGTDGTSSWSTAYFTTPDACSAPTDLISSNITATTATLSWADNQDSYNVRYRKVYFYEDFEAETLPTGWTTIDANSDGNCWYIGHSTSHSGGLGACNLSYVYQQTGITPDDYLVSPLLDLQGTLRVWLSGYNPSYEEYFSIYVSTTGNTASDFTSTTPVCSGTTTNQYVEYTADLSSYAGQQGYIAIRHHNCSDQRYLYVDDFGLYGSENWVSVTPSPTDATTTLTGLTPGIGYEWQVQGLNCNSAGSTTDWSETATFTTLEQYTKTIEAVGAEAWAEGKGGYYLIASPLANNVAPTNVAGMITDEYGAEVTLEASTYDLYSFDQAETDEWRNYRTSNFNLVNGQGYLYASKEGTELVFTGAANSNNTQNVTLSLTAEATGLDFPDWNLVGNPFAKKAYITKSFYTLENSDTYTLNTAGTEILAMQGLLVIADYNNEPLNFTTVAPNSKVAKLNMNVSKDRSVVDQAIISFNEGQQLPKLQFRNGSTKVYMPMDGKEYAIVSAEAMGTMPVNFKAENNGTYTLSFTTEEVNFAYLHLIDNMTGEDVDLLAGASTGSATYTFDAKTTDFESRFKLVFATGDSNDDTFAFYSNGSFVINNEGNATLQVIDVNGRILKSESINGCANVNVNAAQGIYMLRLVNGNDVKVQKVVVR